MSGRAETLLGYPVGRWLKEAHFWAKLVHHEDRERAMAARAAAMAGTGGTLEYRVRAADGRTVWVREAVRVSSDRRGRVSAIRGAMLDITELKQAEEVSLRLSTVLDAASNGHRDGSVVPVELGRESSARKRTDADEERRARFLSQLGSAIGLATEPARIATKLAWVVGEVLGFDLALIAARRRERMEVLGAWPRDLSRVGHADDCELLRRLDRGEPLTRFARMQVRCGDLPQELLGLAVIPLRDEQGARIGALLVGTNRGEGIADAEAQELRWAASSIGEALSVALRCESLASNAARDPLTGLLNYDAFYARFSEELQRTIRRGERLAYARWDLNDLEKVNRLHGRQAGDLALCAFAQILRTEVRPYDVIGRVGDHEFAAVISVRNHEVAHGIAARIQQRAVRARFDGTHYLPFPARGFALYPDDASEMGELVRIAEHRLYNNKQTRNGLIGATLEPSAKLG